MPCCLEGNSGISVNLEILERAHLLVLKTTRFLVVLLAQPFFFSVSVSRLKFYTILTDQSPGSTPVHTKFRAITSCYSENEPTLRPHSFREGTRLDPRERVLPNNQLMPRPH